MWIYLLRHGIAEDPGPGQPDEQRALTPKGLDRLEKAAAAWQKLVPPPQLVLTSPYLRARQTAEIFAKAVGYGDDPRHDESLVPHGRIEQALATLEGELLSRTESVAIVGHEPHLGYLLGSLLTGHSSLSVPFGKGQLTGVETTSPSNVITRLRFSLAQKLAAQVG